MAETKPGAEILSATEALCPECLRRLPATRQRRGDAVWLVRSCPEHGEAEAVIWRGEPGFEGWRRSKTPSAPPSLQTRSDWGCPFDCGLCPEHGQHTCTAVVEVTGLRNPCIQIDCFQNGLMAATLDKDTDGNLIRKAGVMSVVLADGDVRPGDSVRIELPAEPHRPLLPV